MKVIVTCHSYYPNNDGVQFVTQYLCEGLVKKGHEVQVVTNYYKNRNMVYEEEYNGVKIIRINAFTKHTIHFGEKKKYISLIKKLANKNDIMINVCTQCATTDWLLNELKNIKIPKILYLHSIWDFRWRKDDFSSINALFSKFFCNFRWRIYYSINKNKFKLYNCVTQLHKMDYTTLYFKKKYNINSLVMENAAEDVFFDQTVDDSLKLPKKYILNVSNYAKRKNQEKCLELFFEADIPEDWSLILIGSQKNKYYDNLKSKYDNLQQKFKKKKNVLFLFGINRSQISTYVKRSKIYLMTSKWEAFPISLVEAMASKVPFISSDVGIVKYLSGGVVCSKNNEYLYWINEFVSDDEKRLQYGTLGNMEAKKKYKIEEKVNQFEKIVIDLVKKSE